MHNCATLIVALIFVLLMCVIQSKQKYIVYDPPRRYKINFNIDAVITWVDSSDKNWENKKKYFHDKLSTQNNYDNSNNRYSIKTESDLELKICVTSICKFIPWVNNIYIVTARPQKCNWFKYIDKIKVIHHDEIWDDDAELPTFNSNSIEACIHNIPDLAEHFIYFEDDFFIMRHMRRDFFYTDNGKPIAPATLSYEHGIYSILPLKNLHNIHAHTTMNLCNFLNVYGLLYLHHAPIPLTKTLMKETKKYYGDHWINTRQNRFRSIHDISPVLAAVNYNGIISKYHDNSNFFKFIECDDLSNNDIKKIRTDPPYILCINNCNTNEHKKKMQVVKQLFLSL